MLGVGGGRRWCGGSSGEACMGAGCGRVRNNAVSGWLTAGTQRHTGPGRGARRLVARCYPTPNPGRQRTTSAPWLRGLTARPCAEKRTGVSSSCRLKREPPIASAIAYPPTKIAFMNCKNVSIISVITAMDHRTYMHTPKPGCCAVTEVSAGRPCTSPPPSRPARIAARGVCGARVLPLALYSYKL